MTWIAAVPAIAAAAAVVLGPGLLAAAPLRIPVLPRVALAGLLGVPITGLAAVLGGAAGLAFQFWQPLLLAVPIAAASLLRRRRIAPLRGSLSPKLLAPAWTLGGVILAVVAFSGVPDPDRISQTYDNVFHLSATAAILDGFSASPLTLRSLIETEGGGLAYYPAAWHQLAAGTVQLSGASVPIAFNALWLVTSALLWLPGVAWLVQVLLPARYERVAPLVALPLGAVLGAFPYALLSWGTIYPTGLAHTLLPAAVATIVLGIRAVLSARRTTGSAWPTALGGAAVAALAIGFAHPRVLPTLVLIGAPYLLWLAGASYRRARHRGGRTARRAALVLWSAVAAALIVLGTALAVAILQLGLLDEPFEDRLNGPQARAVQPLGEGVLQVLGGSALTGVGDIATAPALLLAIALVAGAVAALRVPRLRWLVVSFALLAALYVLAAGSDGVLAKLLTGLWYKDRFRLAAAVPVVAVPLTVLGVLALGSVAARLAPASRRIGRMRAAVAAGTLAVAISAGGGLLLTGTSSSIASVFRMPAAAAEAEVVSQAQIDFMERLAEIVPEDQRVLGDPWDGSALTQLFGDREPVFPHVNGQWDHNRRVLAWDLERIEDDPEVCRALDSLHVRYVLFDPHEFGGGDPAGNHFPGPHAAIAAGLFTEVATDGRTELYKIEQCGSID